MRKIVTSILAAAFVLTASMLVLAQNSNFNASRTFEFDPDKTRGVYAKWVNGIGENDFTGNKNFGLRLEKNVPTTTVAASGAVLNGLNNVLVMGFDTLGFDIRNDSPCTGGSPRYNVAWSLSDGTQGFSFVGGCGNDNERFSLGNGWTRVRFELFDPTEAFPVVPAGAKFESVVLIVDEQGKYTLDNIEFNDQYADSPGNSRPLP